MSAAIVPAIIAASVAIVVAVPDPALSSLRARREAFNLMFDAAARRPSCWSRLPDTARGVDREYHPGSDEEYHRFTVGMAEKSISDFIDQTVEARRSLAAISRYVPEVRDWITTGWELTQEREPEQRRLVGSCRAHALKTERLLRQSRPLPG